MSYDIKPHGPIGVQLRELFRTELAKALKTFRALESSAGAENAHDARKRLKRLRAILLLVRKPLGKKGYREENAILRDAGRTLGNLRDAQVQVKTFEKIQKRFFPGRPPAVMREVQETLHQHQETSVGQFLAEKKTTAAGDRLEALLERSASWAVEEYGWKELRSAVRRSYRRSRDAYQEARMSRGVEALHDWRKRVKELWFHVRLLRRVYPVLMAELAEDFEVLGEFLGDDHDLAVLREALYKQKKDLEQGTALKTLVELIEVRQEELVEAAFDLGERLHDETPAEFIERLDEQRDSRRDFHRRTKKLASELATA